jgi:hypothetical protein
VFAWVQPAPPDVAVNEDGPDFLGRPYSEINRFKGPIEPNGLAAAYHDAQPFTRLYGTAYADQPLEITFSFSNDDVDFADGRVVCDANIHKLHYDGEALKHLYDPQRQGATGKFFTMIFGRFLRVEVKNVSTAPTKELRVFVRGSVF